MGKATITDAIQSLNNKEFLKDMIDRYANMDEIASEYARRWWYSWGEWPPTGPDYYLNEMKRRGITDEMKPIPHYEGVYVNMTTCRMMDLRPDKGKPSLKNIRNLARQQPKKLLILLLKAFQNQYKEMPDEGSIFEREEKNRVMIKMKALALVIKKNIHT